MAPASTPTRGKRSRRETEENYESLLSSVKKRRLNGAVDASPSTPRALAAIASAISGALGRGRRAFGRSGHPVVPSAQSKSSNPNVNGAYDAPESDEERVVARPLENENDITPSKKKESAKSPRTTRGNSVYDVPESGDELGSTAEPQPSTAANGQTPVKSARGGRAGKGSVKSSEKSRTAARTKEDDLPINDTPLRSRPRAGRDRYQSPSLDTGVLVDDGSDQEPTVDPHRFGSRKGADPLDGSEDSPNGAPRLKGILTPSKRKGIRSRKSVVFDKVLVGPPAEMYFEDLPTNAKVKPKAKKAATLPSKVAKSTPVPKVQQQQQPGAEGDDEEHEDADDVVCVICSKPDSDAPNEIIFCDSCDKGFHQECYDVPVIPKGEWLCHDCSGEEEPVTEEMVAKKTTGKKGPSAGSTIVTKGNVPDIPNFVEHLQKLQRVLLDRCTGKRRIKLRGQDDAYKNAFQLVEQTVLAGEGNSMLVIGARGSGKTTLVESVLSDLSIEHKDEFHVVRLNGFIHTDDKVALKEIWRQLGKEMEVEDEVVNKAHNHADTLASLLAVLSHPSEISGAETGVTSKSVVFVMDEFDLFTTHARQTLLYNLFDIAQARKAPIAVVGLTARVDVVESLEKRVKSRFSHRYVYLSLPRSLAAYWDVCRQGLSMDEQDLDLEGLEGPQEGLKKFHEWWNKEIEALRKERAFQDHLEFHWSSSKSVSAFLTSCILPLASLSPTAPQLRMPSAAASSAGAGAGAGAGVGTTTETPVRLDAPDSNLALLPSLSDLELALLIAAARLDIVAHTDTVNFAMAYDEYTSLIGRQRVQSATSGLLALGGGARAWGRGAAGTAWERLASVGLLTPASGVGRGAGGTGAGGSSGSLGLEARMWKVDVALEEIPIALKQSSIMARWCREI